MEKIKFRRKLGPKGPTVGITIPKELMVFLDIEKGETIVLMPERGKHGKYLSLWKDKDE